MAVEPTTVHIPASARLCFELMDAEANPQHKQALFELDQDPEVMRYVTGGKVTSMQMLETKLIPRMRQYRNPALGWGIWKVLDKTSGEYYGWILVRPWAFFTATPEHHNLEMGWRFKRHCWGKGFATEAAQAVALRLAAMPEVTSLCAIAQEDNLPSMRVMAKLGMRFLRRDIVSDPLFEDELVIYSMPV